MKATKLFLAAIAAIAFASCQNESVEFAKPVTANILCNIGKGLATRAFNATWETGDAIGVFVKENVDGNWEEYSIPKTDEPANNLKYTTSLAEGETIEGYKYLLFPDGTPIPFPSNNNALSFQGYYPHETLVGTGETEFAVNDWSNQENSNTFDLMISEDPTPANRCVKTANEAMTDPYIPLKFHHMFSKIILKVSVNEEATQLRTSDLEGMTISAAGMNVKTTCDVITREINTEGGAVATPISFTTLKVNPGEEAIDNAFEAIICPKYNTNTEDRKVTFTLAGGKGVFEWTIPSGTEFVGGNSYVWSIRLNGDGVTAILEATIVDWTSNLMDGDGNIVSGEVIIDVDKK